MKTVYRIYSVPSCNTSDLDIIDRYPLYAITYDKKIYKDFISQRDMKKFIICKSKMTQEELVKFVNSNNGQMLEYRKYTHYVHPYKSKKHDRKTIEVSILSTWSEKEVVEACIDECIELSDCSSVKYNDVFPFGLKKKYVKALDSLQFIQSWKIFGEMRLFQTLLTEDELSDLDYSCPDFLYDELLLFINFHGNTFKVNLDE